MSHVATIELEVKDLEALAAVAARLELAIQHNATVSFYDGTTITGTAIHLPEWRYPAVIDAQGRLHYDNYQGAWGDMAQLHRLRQGYAEEVTTRWARRRGYRIIRQVAADGAVRLELRR